MATEKLLIDANKLTERIKSRLRNDAIIGWLCGIIADEPTVDAVEVIRCKDCKHWNVHPINGKLTLGKCIKLSRVMADTWFCSYGERRDND